MKITQPVTSLCIVTFQKSFIDFKSTQNITLINTNTCMLNIAYPHGSVVLVIFHYYMLQNKQSNRYLLYSMTSVVVSFEYPIKLNISTRKGVKFHQRSFIIILTDLPNAIKKMSDKFSFHKHFKVKKYLCF